MREYLVGALFKNGWKYADVFAALMEGCVAIAICLSFYYVDRGAMTVYWLFRILILGTVAYFVSGLVLTWVRRSLIPRVPPNWLLSAILGSFLFVTLNVGLTVYLEWVKSGTPLQLPGGVLFTLLLSIILTILFSGLTFPIGMLAHHCILRVSNAPGNENT